VTVSGETPYAIYCQNATTGEGIYHCNNGNCSSTEIISGLPAGSYTLQVLLRSWVYCNAQIDVTVTSGGSNNNSSSCGATFTGGANSFTVSIDNGSSPKSIEYTAPNGGSYVNCNGNCWPTETLTNLAAGNYYVKVTLADWSTCEAWVTVGSGGSTTGSTTGNTSTSSNCGVTCTGGAGYFTVAIQDNTIPYSIQYWNKRSMLAMIVIAVLMELFKGW